MADTVGYTPGTGAFIAVDEIVQDSQTVLFQRFKLVRGGNGVNGGDITPDNPFPGSVPSAKSVVILNLTTSATGANYTAFGNQACDCLDIINTSSVAIEYRRGGAGSTMTILSGSSRLVVGITNANQIEVRRVDQSNTQVTIPAEAIVI